MSWRSSRQCSKQWRADSRFQHESLLLPFRHLNMVLGDVDETILSVEINEETNEPSVKVRSSL